MKFLYFILGLLISVTSHAVSYTTMTIDAVKQSNGVWTAAGVLDNTGIVRTTGAVTVSGAVKNLPVEYVADKAAASALLRSASRLAGPVALAATAYEVYQWVTENGISAQGDTWTKPVDGSTDSGFSYGMEWRYSAFNSTFYASSPDKACKDFNARNTSAYLWSKNYRVFYSSDSVYSCQTYSGDWVYTTGLINIYRQNCSTGSQSQSCLEIPTVTDADFAALPDPTWQQLSAGFNSLPSLQTNGVPINGDSAKFVPFSTWMGQAYFRDGNWYRDRMDVSPCPTATNPARVCVSIGPVKLDGHTDPNTTPEDTDPNYSTGPKTEQEFCAANPNSISCQEMGEAESEPLQNDTVQFNMNPTPWGADNAQCPASPQITLHTGAVVKFDYQPTCDFLAMLRPAIIAFAFMVAIGIAIGRTE